MLYEFQFASVFLNGSRFTEFLGIIAILAFGATAGWIMLTLFRDASKKQTVAAAESFTQTQSTPSPLNDPKALYKEEVKRIELECGEFYEEAIKTAKAKLGELVVHARLALRNISGVYAKVSRNPDSAHMDTLSKHFTRVCENQWEFFKGELGYIGYNDIEPHIRMIFNCQAMADQIHDSDDESQVNLGPAMSRAQEILFLQNSIPTEKMGSFQMDSMTAVEPFKVYFDSCVKEWVNDCLFQIIDKIRTKGDQGASIKDTDFRDRFVRLKNTVETMSRLSERVESNMQEVGEQDAAFNQIIFGSVIMSIIANAPHWFPELGDAEIKEETDLPED